jgi:pheromone shutdown protein TraB
LLMFVNSVPTEKYTIIGEVAMNLIDSRKYEDQISTIINKIKKQYPEAYAVIINTKDSRFTAEVITFNDLK